MEMDRARRGSTASTNSTSVSVGYDDAPCVNEGERRSFLHAYSRKSIELNPEDEEFVVGDDGTISLVPVDDHARLERLRQLLDKKERETRQAAEYGLSLLEANEELELEIESLKLRHEAEMEEMEAERDMYRRHHELTLQEVESWKSESKKLEEVKYQLSNELETLASRCVCQREGSRLTFSQQQQRIQELEAALVEARASDVANTAVIKALKKWKSVVESEKRENQGMTEEEASSERLYTQKLEQDNTRLQQQLEIMSWEKKQLNELVAALEDTTAKMKADMEELQGELKKRNDEVIKQTDLLLTAESKCIRLERERAIMEQVANLPMAVFDRDSEEGGDSESDDSANQDHISEKTASDESSADEHWFVQSSKIQKEPGTPSSEIPFTLPGEEQRVPSTPSSLATHQKLHHYFHLTALSIIHENDLHERCFNSSSRSTIDTWYREVVDEGVQFLEWHSWLINRIGAVAAAVQSEEEQALEASGYKGSSAPSGSSSPFQKFLRRRRRQDSAMPSPMPKPAPRVSTSVAWTFFSRLMGRRDDNQDATDI